MLLSDLPNVERLPGDKNDPFVVMECAGVTRKTGVENNAGDRAVFQVV